MSKHILVVDDSVSIRQMVEMTLKGAGYTVTTAQDGQDALDKCKSQQFNFVLTDQNMPRMVFCNWWRCVVGTPQVSARISASLVDTIGSANTRAVSRKSF